LPVGRDHGLFVALADPWVMTSWSTNFSGDPKMDTSQG
jgi:hypothetical protein